MEDKNERRLPPLPKLRPRPGLKAPIRFPPKISKEDVILTDSPMITITMQTDKMSVSSRNISPSSPATDLISSARIKSTKKKLVPKSSMKEDSETRSITPISFSSNILPHQPNQSISRNSLNLNTSACKQASSSQLVGSPSHLVNTASPITTVNDKTMFNPSFTSLVCPPPMFVSQSVKKKLKPSIYIEDNHDINISSVQSSYTIKRKEDKDSIEDDKTSKLVMKTDCKGGRGGRKRNGDGAPSLVHSIPKFSEVIPKGGKISEVQKVLQSRLLSKRRERMQNNNNDENGVSSKMCSLESNHNAVSPSVPIVSSPMSLNLPTHNVTHNQPSENTKCMTDIDLKATNILQSMIKLHEKTSENDINSIDNGCSPKHPLKHGNNSKPLQIKTPGSLISLQTSNLSKSAQNINLKMKDHKISTKEVHKHNAEFDTSDLMNSSNNKRKSRKPNKRQICHVVQGNNIEKETPPINDDSHTTGVKFQQNSSNVSDKQSTQCYTFAEEKTVHLSPEVTITPTKLIVHSKENQNNTAATNYEKNPGKIDAQVNQNHPIRSTSTLQMTQEHNNVSTSPTLRNSQNKSSKNIIETSQVIRPILSPEEYESSGLPSGYIYWPTGNVFVHPSTIPEHFLSDGSTFTKVDSESVEEDIKVDIEEEEEDEQTINPKYRKILPKEVQHGRNENQLTTNKGQIKNQISTSHPSPHENISQYTR